VIRFSAFLVVVAVGLLVAGVVTSQLLLVYIAIGVSGVALLALGAGATVNWRELTGQRELTGKTAETSAQGPVPQAAVPERVTAPAAAGAGHAGVTPAGVAPAGSGWPVTTPSAPSSPSPVGYLPAAEPPPRARPAAAPASAAGQPPGSRPPDTPACPRPRSPSVASPQRPVCGSGATMRSRPHLLRASPLLRHPPHPGRS